MSSVNPIEEAQPLWDHQPPATQRCLNNTATLLDMGMGTGKTRCVVDAVLVGGWTRVLVICPCAVMHDKTWQKNFRKYYPSRVHFGVCDKGRVADKVARAQNALDIAEALQEPACIIINYESAWRDEFAAFAKSIPWDAVILDEAHRIKAPGGKASRFCSQLGDRVKKRIALTGTPIPNGPMDAYALYRFLDKKIFGHSFVKFRARYAVMGGYNNHQILGYTNEDEFKQKFDSIRYHVDRSVLNLPEAIHVERTFELPPKARRVYQSLEDDFYAQVDAGEITVSNALVKLLRLQQITSGYVPVDGEDTDRRPIRTPTDTELLHTEKGEHLIELFDELDKSEPVVVFCRFRADLEWVHRAAEAAGRLSSELSGERKELGQWQDGATTVLAVQIDSGAEGIDLTRAAYCVFYSLGFSLARYEQALARTHRPGQKRTCFYYHLIAENTVDRKVYGALQHKKDVIRSIIEGN